MKSIKKIALAVLALAFVAMAQTFAAKAPTVVATYVGEEAVDDQEEKAVLTITFYSDKTFVVHGEMSGELDMGEEMGSLYMMMDADIIAGTYKGDPKKDGKITLTATKTMTEDYSEETTAKLLGAMMAGEPLEITNEDMPLVELPKSEWEKLEITIKDGQFEYDGTVVTRVAPEGK